MIYFQISRKFLFRACVLTVLSTPVFQSSAQLFSQDSLKLISRQFSFTEGPSVNKKGEIFFTDQPNNKIWKYSTGGQLSLFKANAGRANGTYFDARGNLLACADEHNELWSIDQKGKVKVLLHEVEGKKLNGPNDLWVDKSGGIYFTDPYFQRDYWTRQKPEIEGQKVYYLPSGKNASVRVAAGDLSKPNGIVGSADGKYLYVADGERDKTYQYTILNDGSLTAQKVIIGKGSDGMTIDNHGNFYLTGKGVYIYNSQGELIGHIAINEPWTSNVCFGGTGKHDLFITASTAVYTIPLQATGTE